MLTKMQPLRPAGGIAFSRTTSRSWTEALQTLFSEDQVNSIRGPSWVLGENLHGPVRAAMSRPSSVQLSSRASSKRWREEPSEVLLEVDSVDGALPPGSESLQDLAMKTAAPSRVKIREFVRGLKQQAVRKWCTRRHQLQCSHFVQQCCL